MLCLEPCDPECKRHYIIQDTLCPEWQCLPVKEGHTDSWLIGLSIFAVIAVIIASCCFYSRIKRWCKRHIYQRIPGVDLEMVERGVPVDAVNGGNRVPTAPPEVQQPLINDLNEGNQPIIT